MCDKIQTGPLSILRMDSEHITYLGASTQIERSWGFRREEAAVVFLAREPRFSVHQASLKIPEWSLPPYSTQKSMRTTLLSYINTQ